MPTSKQTPPHRSRWHLLISRSRSRSVTRTGDPDQRQFSKRSRSTKIFMTIIRPAAVTRHGWFGGRHGLQARARRPRAADLFQVACGLEVLHNQRSAHPSPGALKARLPCRILIDWPVSAPNGIGCCDTGRNCNPAYVDPMPGLAESRMSLKNGTAAREGSRLSSCREYAWQAKPCFMFAKHVVRGACGRGFPRPAHTVRPKCIQNLQCTHGTFVYDHVTHAMYTIHATPDDRFVSTMASE